MSTLTNGVVTEHLQVAPAHQFYSTIYRGVEITLSLQSSLAGTPYRWA